MASSQAVSAAAARTPARSRAADRWAARRLQAGLGAAPVRVVLWDGYSPYARAAAPVGSVVIRTRRVLAALLRDAELAFGEAYTAGTLTVEGDLVELLEAVNRARLAEAARHAGRRRWHDRLATGSLGRHADNIARHYDLGNDFYRRWLDDQMLYTCAYFPSPSVTLEEAQVAKMEHVCRKLRLQPGERVVEAGCGWGALALHMARRYGVTVTACNISREQVRYARARAQAEGLDGRVTFLEADYRTLTGTYDVFVSVGMLEHVGLEHYRTLGAIIHRLVDPARGRGLLHFIGRNHPQPLNAWIRKYIFAGYPPTLAEAADRVLGGHRFTVLDVENLRLHYALTLRHWRARFERAVPDLPAPFDDRFVRAWRLYLAGSEAAFTTGWLQLFQVVFARPGDNAVPWTRAFLYGGAG